MKKTVVIGFLGTVLDAGVSEARWSRWRPSVSLCQHEDFLVDRLELLTQKRFKKLSHQIEQDIQTVSPETQTRFHNIQFRNPWNLEEVYAALHDFSRSYAFDTDKEDYLIHITTGTHVAQICLYLLTESHYLPGKLIQTSPPVRQDRDNRPGTYTIIDLDLSKYDRIASRFRKEQIEGVSFLKSGIETKNNYFNQLMERIEKVAIASKSPILLMGPTGAGKSQLAKRIYQLKKTRRQVEGEFVEINCATIRGEAAMSALFGHIKGAFTGAMQDRPGLLKKAHKGILFLDEIGELGADEQAMLLRALEEKTFLPLGADKESSSDFQLIAGTNKNLQKGAGDFREDLLARINLWTFTLPPLRDRKEDIEPNIQYELDEFSRLNNTHVTFNKEARKAFLDFAVSQRAKWDGNFRDLNAAINRMATLMAGGRIDLGIVKEEIDRLILSWTKTGDSSEDHLMIDILGEEKALQLDLFDKPQLLKVLQVCQSTKSMSDAGRILFAKSRTKKKTLNDADRLRKYLAKFGLTWDATQTTTPL
ncbi:MAG: RNA repair transcriptional activator RtcR [Nitrospinota bacterium]|nr:RNA repair transcriptional activator RtcR [Nitrospinota bacterium]